VSEPFFSPTVPADSRTEVFLRYLDYLRSRVTSKLQALPAAEWRRTRLPSGWTPMQLLKHLRHVERRWLEWGFEGRDVGDPWADRDGDRWAVADEETPATLLADFRDQTERSRAIIIARNLDEVGQPGERWDGADPATLERVLFHLVQEYARHLGQLDVVVELATGLSEELSNRSFPLRRGSRTRRGPRSRCAAPDRAAGRPAVSWRRLRRQASRWR